MGRNRTFLIFLPQREAKRLIQFQARKKENNYVYILQHVPVDRRDTQEKEICANNHIT